MALQIQGHFLVLQKQSLQLYNEHYPQSIHKIPSQQLIQINDDLRQSYVDDIHIGTTLVDVQNEQNTPSFSHSHVKNYDNLRITKKSEQITIARALKMLHILDFNGFAIKRFHSSSLTIQNTLNQDIILKIKDEADYRPYQSLLQQEILAR